MAKRRPGKILTKDRAISAFNKRQRHTAVVGPIECPFAFVEFYGNWINVSFFDKFLRVSAEYSFKEVKPGRVFLTMATTRKFDGESDRAVYGESYIFKEDGAVTLRENNIAQKQLKISKRIADVSANWDVYPKFGEYDCLLRWDRSPCESSNA